MHAYFTSDFRKKTCCYIARVNTKRDWLICGHVTSEKCNVSRRATNETLRLSGKQNKLFPSGADIN
jgi:hypothetical protein